MSRGPSPRVFRRRMRRAYARHRRLLVALLVAGSVTAGLSAVAPASPPLVDVLVAAHDLAAGAALAPSDVTTEGLSPASVPDGAFGPSDRWPVGQVLATAVRRGEPLTDVRLMGPGLLAGTHGLVAVALRVADAGAADLVRVGDVVDVLGVGAPDPVGTPVGADPSASSGSWDGGAAMTVAAGVRVLAVPEGPSGGGTAAYGDGIEGGVLLVVATTASGARRLALAQASSRLSVVVLAQETPA